MILMRFICVKQYSGAFKTGGHYVFEVICEGLKRIGDVDVVEFPLYNTPSFLKRLEIAVKMVRFVEDSLKAGYNVYGVGELGTIDYIQQTILDYGLTTRFRRYREWLQFALLRRFRDNRKIKIYVSRYAASRYATNAADADIVYPPVKNYEKFFDPSRKEDLIITVSRITKEKNLELVGRLSETLPYKFAIIGFLRERDTDYLNSFKHRYPRVDIRMNVSEDEKADWLSRAKILLHPAINDPFPLTRLEAMSCGTVPLVHNSGGSPEGIPSDFIYNNIEECNTKIKKYLDGYDGALARSLIEKSRAFSPERFMENFNSIVCRRLDIKC